jgi:hypothetical protein
MTKKTDKKKSAAKQTPQRSTVTPRALKLADACVYLGRLSKSTVRRAVKRRLLTPSQATRHWLFQIEELDRFLELGRRTFATQRAAKQGENGDAE